MSDFEERARVIAYDWEDTPAVAAQLCGHIARALRAEAVRALRELAEDVDDYAREALLNRADEIEDE